MNFYMYYLVSQTSFKDTFETQGERIAFAAQVALIGILTVFSVLAILWGCLEIFKYVFYTLPEKRKNEQVENTSAIEETAIVEETVEASNEEEIVAAIMAAITAMEEEKGVGPSGFRVVSFKKVR